MGNLALETAVENWFLHGNGNVATSARSAVLVHPEVLQRSYASIGEFSCFLAPGVAALPQDAPVAPIDR
jgi:hypothetical protein